MNGFSIDKMTLKLDGIMIDGLPVEKVTVELDTEHLLRCIQGRFNNLRNFGNWVGLDLDTLLESEYRIIIEPDRFSVYLSWSPEEPNATRQDTQENQAQEATEGPQKERPGQD